LCILEEHSSAYRSDSVLRNTKEAGQRKPSVLLCREELKKTMRSFSPSESEKAGIFK